MPDATETARSRPNHDLPTLGNVGASHYEKESIRVGPVNSERWPIAAWPGPGRIGLIELNRAPMEIGMPLWGWRRSAVRARAGCGARKRTEIRALAACDEAGWSSWRADRGR